MKILLLLLKNNLIQLCRLNQLRYADNQKRRNTIYLYIFVGTILIGGLVYLSYSLNIVFSLSWTLDEIIINLILPVILICMILNVFISIFWGSGLLLSDTNIDNLLAFPVPLMVLIISKLSILYLVQAVLDMTLLFPMAVLFGLTADMKISYYPVMAGVVLLFPIIPGLLGTIVGTKVHHILKSSSALVTRLKSTCNIKRTDWNTLNLWNMLFASEILLKLIAVGWVYCVRHYSTVNKYFGTLSK